MKNSAFPCTPLVVHNAGAVGLVSQSDLAASGSSLGLRVGIPMMRNWGGVVVWEPGPVICRFWSIEGGGTIAA